MTILAITIALLFAMNIGASGTAASMGAAYGGGAIKSKFIAITLVSIFAIIGALFGSGEVVKTISGGIIPSDIITLSLTTIILTSACVTLLIANIISIPLSTSEVTVGSLVGVGIAYQQLYVGHLLFIVVIWIVFPFISYVIANFLGRFVTPTETYLKRFNMITVRKTLVALLIIAGCYEALSAGMNNVANAIGPLIASHAIGIKEGTILGAIFLALGAFLLGGRVLETNGKKITKLSLLQGSIVSFTSGTLVIIASMFGLPVPLTQATTMAIVGVGTRNEGNGVLKKSIVRQIFKTWVISPLSSLIISYSLVNSFLLQNHVPLFVLVVGLSFFFILKNVSRKKNEALLQKNKPISNTTQRASEM